MSMPTNAPPDQDRYICIHGHFYQPPRENPWLETVETQDSAAPFHDWNERITAECYAPNGASRILNAKNEIIRILNNYSRISFNYGPTLLSWLEQNAPRTYRRILDADRVSQGRFGGHGSAMAQVYNHVIMPLANRRDKLTQIRWGIADFVYRFGRRPEGMWLAETAVDSETLELMADEGIAFTVLAPHQCAGVRRIAGPKDSQEAWTPTPGTTVDTRRPYLVRCENGKSIAVYFYDGPPSRAIAFEGLLDNGEVFARRLLEGFSNGAGPQLVHVATDGESYGHHHKHGEMALSYALKWIERGQHAKITNYGEFLALFPPAWEAQIAENTSWSCFHGIERWRSNCGCNGGRQGWNQEWRAPLRHSLDWLRDAIAPLFETMAASLYTDIWKARDSYISVVLDRKTETVDAFFSAHSRQPLSPAQRTTALKLMEMQRHALLMFTSCAWFFDEISGIETVQIIAYAGRVLQLAAELFGDAGRWLEQEFITRMKEAKSNVPEEQDGGAIYRRVAKDAKVGLEEVAAHYAISSAFTSYPQETLLFCYNIRRQAYEAVTSGKGRLAIGEARITSSISEEAESVVFAVLHFGDQNITAGVKRYEPSQADAHAEFIEAARLAVTRADFPEVVRLFDRYFEGRSYSIHSLFRDEQRRILEIILESTLAEVESSLTRVYEDHASLLHFLSLAKVPKPPALAMAAGFAIDAGLRRALRSDPVDAAEARNWLSLAKADKVDLDQQVLGFLADQQMKSAMDRLYLHPEIAENLENALLTAILLGELPFEPTLWHAQNIWNKTLKLVHGNSHSSGDANTAIWNTADWMRDFLELGTRLRIAVRELVVEEDLSMSVPTAAAYD